MKPRIAITGDLWYSSSTEETWVIRLVGLLIPEPSTFLLSIGGLGLLMPGRRSFQDRSAKL